MRISCERKRCAHETYVLFEITVLCVSDVLGVTGLVEIKVVGEIEVL